MAQIVMIHENDVQRDGCEFEHFFVTRPQDLIDAGLYTSIALAFHPTPHREVSLALPAAKSLHYQTISLITYLEVPNYQHIPNN